MTPVSENTDRLPHKSRVPVPRRTTTFVLALVLAAFCTSLAQAQELSPRAYWPAPRGAKALVVGANLATGDILTDPSLPVVGVDSRLRSGLGQYLHTFSLAGRTASVLGSATFTEGTTEGVLEGLPIKRSLSGWGDASARLAVNLLGAPTMDRAGMQALRDKPRPILGTSVTVRAPTGGYEADKLVNLGSNRWAVKPAIGLIYPLRRGWLAEFDLSTWFFSDNDEFVLGTREQAPIATGEFHLVKRIRPGFWFSIDLNYYAGGRTTVNGERRADLQRNSRFGGTVVFPFKQGHAIRAGFSTGVVTSSGNDFENLGVSYQFLWF